MSYASHCAILGCFAQIRTASVVQAAGHEHHGAWYVRYRQRILQEDGSAKLNHASKHLGRSADFSNIFEVKRCRASFMQAVNRDRFTAHSRITLTAFVEGAYVPWTKEERRASTSKGHHEIWINRQRR